MSNRTFKTYQKLKKEKRSIGSLVVICGLAIVLILVVINAFLQTKFLEILYETSILLFLIFFAYIVLKSFKQQEKQRKENTGTLELLSDKILLNKRSIALDEIKRLSIKLGNLDGNEKTLLISTPNPSIADRFNNMLCVSLTSEEVIQINFEQSYDQQFTEINRDILIEYYKAGVLPLTGLLEILGIEGFEEIQAFKRTLIDTDQ